MARWLGPCAALAGCIALVGCDASGSAGRDSGRGDAGALDAGRRDASGGGDAGRSDAGSRDAGAGGDGGAPAGDAEAPRDAGPPRGPLAANRDRLLGTYFDHLRERPDEVQSNGLRGADLGSVCDLWSRLDPSARAVFLTITARLQGSILGSDGSAMLDHVTRVYRIAGGEGATASDPGSCGGGEHNRMIMSMDAALHAALLAAHARGGARRPDGRFDIADIPEDGRWRDSEDLAGPHDPFDRSNETEDGAPRGQVHYFADPSSSLARSPLGRSDVEALVDPFAFEMDHDFDCVHSSNPLCEYTFYGPFCIPRERKLGLDIYVEGYGDIEADWAPPGC
ncbi:MAG TPA: hypothetical protein VIL20_17530 [Sandaracinaceae bacterium]